MRDRILAIIAAFIALAGAVAAPLPAVASVAPVKVVIIVGPVGSTTTYYRSQGDGIAAAAQADGATVVKVYSPNATWPAVKAAVAGANIIVYLGHGNGYPNPYSSTYLPDRVDGWGLNTATTNGDADSWSAGTLVYCGEKALTGSLTSSDGAAQRQYCSGGPITPAPGFVMVYANACYAPGASEPGATPATPTQALQRVGYFSRPVLTTLDGSGYFATDQGATPLVHGLLTHPGLAYGDIYTSNKAAGLTAADSPHPLVAGKRAWLALRSTDPYYTYAFAGDPTRTFAGGTAALTLPAPPAASSPPSQSSTAAGVTLYNPARLIHFSAGSTTGYKFDSAGRVIATKTYSLSRASSASASQRSKVIPGHPGAWYLIVNGVWAGYWVQETTRTYLPGIAEQVNYSPVHTVSFTAGSHTGYRFTSSWAVSSSKSYTLARASSASTSTWAVINGRGYAYIVNGVWAGYWMPTGGGVTVN